MQRDLSWIPCLGGFHHWRDWLHWKSSSGETPQVDFSTKSLPIPNVDRSPDPHDPHISHVSQRSTAVRTVFLLIRAKRGASPASRLDSLLSSQLFDTVKSQVLFCL